MALSCKTPPLLVLNTNSRPSAPYLLQLSGASANLPVHMLPARTRTLREKFAGRPRCRQARESRGCCRLFALHTSAVARCRRGLLIAADDKAFPHGGRAQSQATHHACHWQDRRRPCCLPPPLTSDRAHVAKQVGTECTGLGANRRTLARWQPVMIENLNTFLVLKLIWNEKSGYY